MKEPAKGSVTMPNYVQSAISLGLVEFYFLSSLVRDIPICLAFGAPH
jgi:hypothetical protein